MSQVKRTFLKKYLRGLLSRVDVNSKSWPLGSGDTPNWTQDFRFVGKLANAYT